MRLIQFFICLFLLLPFSLLADVDEDFVVNKLLKLEKLIDKGEFVDGQLFKDNDTINTSLLKFTKKDGKLFHFLCIEKKADEYITHYTTDIDGFKVLDDLYIKIHLSNKLLFIKRIAYGFIDLYEKRIIPSDTRYLYFLHEKGTYNLHVINPEKSDVRAMDVVSSKKDSDISFIVSEVGGLHSAFVSLVKKTMGDCERVKTMIKSNYFVRDDLIDLVNAYNKCFD